MGPLLLRIFFGGRWLDGVNALSEPGIHHLPMEKEKKISVTSVTDVVLDVTPFIPDS